MALLEANDGKEWSEWDEALVHRQPEALKAKQEELQEAIQYHRFVQFKFFEQWKALRSYANQKGIQIVGDISIYVCYNSADVWASPKCFKLDPETLRPTYIAGGYRLITSAPPASCGVTPFTTGTICKVPTLTGGLSALRPPWNM